MKKSFLDALLKSFSELYVTGVSGYIEAISVHFQQGNIDEVLENLKIFFANVPYDLHLKHEKYYQTIFYTIFELLGFNISTEVKTNRGRVDAVVEMDDKVYIFEFKLFDTKEEAMKQIKKRKYYEKHLKKDKELVLIGVEFDQTERNIGAWVVDNVR